MDTVVVSADFISRQSRWILTTSKKLSLVAATCSCQATIKILPACQFDPLRCYRKVRLYQNIQIFTWVVFTVTWAEKSVLINFFYITDKTDPQGVRLRALCKETVAFSTFFLRAIHDLLNYSRGFHAESPFPKSKTSIRIFRTLKAGAGCKYICFRPMLIRFILCGI